jgi:hypothetical protein
MIRNATDPILKINETVISIADETIPKTSTNPKHPGKPWFNDECKDAIKNRKKVVRKTSNIGQPRQFPYLQGESSKNIEAQSAHFLA